jgi:hypothetical protein
MHLSSYKYWTFATLIVLQISFALSLTSVYGQQRHDEIFYYEEYGIKYASMVKLSKQQMEVAGTHYEVAVFSSDTLNVIFMRDELSTIIRLKENLLTGLCAENQPCSFKIEDKTFLQDKNNDFKSMEEGKAASKSFKSALVKQGDQFFFLFVSSQGLSQKTLKRLNRMYGYLIL